VSLRTRLLIALGFVAIVALLAADFATYSSLRSFLLTRVDQGLSASHGHVEQALLASNNGGQFGPGGGSPGPGGPTAGDLPEIAPQTAIVLRTASGSTIESQSYYPRGNYPSQGSGGYFPRLPTTITGFRQNGGYQERTKYFDASSAEAGGPEFRVVAIVEPQGEQLILAVPLTDTNDTLHRLLLIELAVTGGAILLAIAAGWWLVRLGMRPLRDIEQTAGAIAEGKLDQRVPGENATTEVGRLATALNVMLGRIQDAFAARDRTEGALRRSETRLRQFVADASHELRTPVAAVSAYAELFERGADERPEDLARVMQGIRGETTRMGHLVDDLLLLARLDEHRPIERAPVDLVALAGEAVEAARTVGPEWPLTLRAEHPVEVSGDGSRLRQVFDNLLANVRAHTPPGTETTITIIQDGDAAVCTVADDGPGIPADTANRLFERFYRVDPSRSRSSGGAGLGLSIVAAIVAAHGGTVTAAPTNEGKGSAFTVRIPVEA
jgi:two-component system OmpR family sensor kinase